MQAFDFMEFNTVTVLKCQLLAQPLGAFARPGHGIDSAEI
jgi:hypothetical protein